jgi:hypothetical protein
MRTRTNVHLNETMRPEGGGPSPRVFWVITLFGPDRPYASLFQGQRRQRQRGCEGRAGGTAQHRNRCCENEAGKLTAS